MKLVMHKVMFTDTRDIESNVSGKERTADDASEIHAIIQKRYLQALARYSVLKNDVCHRAHTIYTLNVSSELSQVFLIALL